MEAALVSCLSMVTGHRGNASSGDRQDSSDGLHLPSLSHSDQSICPPSSIVNNPTGFTGCCDVFPTPLKTYSVTCFKLMDMVFFFFFFKRCLGADTAAQMCLSDALGSPPRRERALGFDLMPQNQRPQHSCRCRAAFSFTGSSQSGNRCTKAKTAAPFIALFSSR